MRFPAFLAAAAVLVQLPGLRAPAVHDDHGWVLRNPKLADAPALARGFWDPARREVDGVRLPSYAWRPLTEASFALNFAIRPSIAGLRAGNLLIHAAASVLAFLLLRRLLGEGPARWGALLFAVHPLGVQAVTYVYQRSVCLAAALSFLCLLLYLKGRTRWALAAGFLAAMSKETAAVLPLSLAAIEGFREGRDFRRLLPFLAVPALVGVMVLRAGSDANPSLGPLEYLAAEMPVVSRYLLLHAFPFPLGFVHPRPMPGEVPLAPALLCGGVLLGLLLWILRGPERHRGARLGLALLLSPLALESTLIPIEDVAWSYRCYPGLLGAGMLFGLLRWRIPLLLFAGLSLGEAWVWRQPFLLMRRDVRHAPRVPEVRGDYAFQLLDGGHAVEAERLCRRAGPHVKVRTALARALSAQGRMEEARGILGEDPDSEFALLEAVDQAGKRSDRAALERLASRVEAMRAPGPILLLWLARRKAEGGDPAGGEGILRAHEAALRANPLFWDHLGGMLLAQGKASEAERAYRRAVKLDPSLFKSWNNLGLVLFKAGRRAEAAEAFRKALEAKPDYALARRNLEAAGR